MGPVPTTHNTKALDLTDSLSVKISFNQNSMLTSLLRGHPELCTHTGTNKNTCAQEIQEVINNRLFSQERNNEARSSGNLWNPSTFDTLRAIHHVSSRCFTVLILLHPLLSPTFLLFYPHNSRILMEFSSVMKTSGVYICESFLWSVSWPGGWPQHWAFSGLSQSAVQGITIAKARGRWDLAL